MRVRHLLVVPPLVAGAMHAAAAPTPISACGSIKSPGSYILDRDLTAGAGNCIEIMADRVTLDLNGHTITGFGHGIGTGIVNVGNVSGSVVRNGTVANFENGVYLSASGTGYASAIVEKIRVLDTATWGIYVKGGAILDSLVSRGGYHGIAGGRGTLIRGNVVTEAKNYGIYAEHGSTVTGNILYANGQYGVHAFESTVSGNTVHSTGGWGISANCPSAVVGNTANASGWANLSLVNPPLCSVADNAAP
jgi:hypothetical protein